jgi:hypothetical protein
MVSKKTLIHVVAAALLLPTSLLQSQTTQTYVDQASRTLRLFSNALMIRAQTTAMSHVRCAWPRSFRW